MIRRRQLSWVTSVLLAMSMLVPLTITAPAAAATTVGPSECKFDKSLTSPQFVHVSRFEVCTWFKYQGDAVNRFTGKKAGTIVVKFGQWFKMDGKSTKVHRGVALQVLSATGLTAAGIELQAPNPCVPIPRGCVSDGPANVLNLVRLLPNGVATSEWDETFQLPGPTPLVRGTNAGSLHDQLTVQVFPLDPVLQSPPPMLEPVTPDFWCDALQGSTYAGCVDRTVAPAVTFDGQKNPLVDPVAHHIAAAQALLPGAPGKDSEFELLADPAAINANRDRHCDLNAGFHYDKPRNDACDDYPFAMVKQSTADRFSVNAVPKWAEDARNAVMLDFIGTNHLWGGDKFKVAAKLSNARSGSVAPYTTLNDQFNSYGTGATCADWSGGDATNSVRLPNGQRAWFFSDSFLGNPIMRHDLFGYSSLHNSIVMQNGSSMRTITGGNTCQEGNLSKDFWDRYAKTIAPAADQGGFYWTGDQRLVDDNTVVKFYYHGRPAGNSWINDYAAVARIPVGQFSNAVMSVQPTDLRCSTDPKVLWGTMTTNWSDNNIYVYGTGATAPQHLYLARTTLANLSNFGSWQFLSSVDTKAGTAGWSSSCAAATELPIGLATGGSVSYINNTLWLVQDTDNLVRAAGGSIEAFPSATPWGFSDRHITLYLPPEAHHDYPYYYQVYEPRIQRDLNTASGDYVLSYNVNTSAVDSGCVSASNYDARIYRPRFLTVPASWFNQDDASSWDTGATAPDDNATSIGGVADWNDHWGFPCPTVQPAANLTATVNTTGSVSLDWTVSGTDIWSYLYQCDATTTACSTSSSCTSNAGGFTKQYDGLWIADSYVVNQPITSAANNGHTFVWYVCSSGAQGGGGGPSNHVTAKVTLPVPAAPTNLHGSRSGTSVSLAWTGVTFPNASVYYTPYFWDITAGGTPANAAAGAPVTATSLTITVPNATHTYGFLLKASNVAGAGPPSNSITL